MLVDPRVFIEEYVTPAIELYRTNHLVKHLAVHAMTQVDVLAAAVLLWDVQGRPLKKGEENKFRNELGTREPTLALIRDAHDGHKHGALNRKTATAASKGQRPEQVTKSGWFYGHSFLDPDDPPIAYDALVFTRDDKTEEEIFPMLHNAMQAWERELGRRGL